VTGADQPRDEPQGRPLWIKLFLGFNLAALGLFILFEVGSSLVKSDAQKEQIRRQAVSDIHEALKRNPAGFDYTGGLSPKITYTIDSSRIDEWVHFRFADGHLTRSGKIANGSRDWDIAFHRAKIVTNGGATAKEGTVAVAVIEGASIDSIIKAPGEGYFVDQPTNDLTETLNPALDKWYIYDFWRHTLKPKNNVYLLRTSDGGYAKFRIESYYCGVAAACYTMEYVYSASSSGKFTG